jgi:hypothetical protein
LITYAVGDNHRPEEQGEECWWNDDTLDPEENPKLRDWHERQKALDEPVEEEAQKASGGNARIFGEVVREVDETGPDRLQATLKEISGLNC